MRLALSLLLCMITLSPLSNAEALDKDKFLAPGSEKTDLRAPQNNDAIKAPGVANPADGPSGPGNKLPIEPINGACPNTYHCNVNSSGGFRCLPNRNGMGIIGPEVCSNITRLCKIYRDAIAAGRPLDESDAAKFAYYCS